jgi:GNAT superfamily N-acetyltransferase
LLERAGSLVGFAAMVDDYDLHHCVRGLRVIDMYVAAAHRGRCLGAVLLAQVAQHALGKCLGYVRGEAVPTATTRRLFERTLLRFGDTYNLSGKALRRLAELRDAPLRELVRGLPTREMNVEP